MMMQIPFFCEKKELVRGIRTSGNSTDNILIGYIENRETWMSGFTTSNFRDMLKYEFVESGFSVLDLYNQTIVKEEKQKKKKFKGKVKAKITSKKKKGKAIFDDETPEYMAEEESITVQERQPEQDIAGEQKENDKYFQIAGENLMLKDAWKYKRLGKKEIVKLAKKTHSKFFIQGALSIQDNNEFIDTKKSSFIFLSIFDAQGELVGMINFAVEEDSLYEADDLKLACQEIVKKFSAKIN